MARIPVLFVSSLLLTHLFPTTALPLPSPQGHMPTNYEFDWALGQRLYQDSLPGTCTYKKSEHPGAVKKFIKWFITLTLGPIEKMIMEHAVPDEALRKYMEAKKEEAYRTGPHWEKLIGELYMLPNVLTLGRPWVYQDALSLFGQEEWVERVNYFAEYGWLEAWDRWKRPIIENAIYYYIWFSLDWWGIIADPTWLMSWWDEVGQSFVTGVLKAEFADVINVYEFFKPLWEKPKLILSPELICIEC